MTKEQLAATIQELLDANIEDATELYEIIYSEIGLTLTTEVMFTAAYKLGAAHAMGRNLKDLGI